MKSIAILKDSFRESWDSKILLVLCVFAMIFAILIASVGYTPVPADAIFQRAENDLRAVIPNKGNIRTGFRENIDVTYTLSNFKVNREAKNPANGEYQFTLTVTPKTAEEIREAAGQVRKKGFPKKDVAPPVKDAPKNEQPKNPDDPEELNSFQTLVVLWHLDIAEKLKQVSAMGAMTEEQKKELSKFYIDSKMMEDFIIERLEFEYSVKIKSATRKTGPLSGVQEFDVVTAESDPKNWPHHVELFFGSVSLKSIFPSTPLGRTVFRIQNYLVNGIGAAIAIILGIIITSFFIPNMLRKGAIDLMISKPVSRTTLLINKYLGGTFYMLIFSTVSVGSVWLVTGIRAGIWNPNTLLLIPLLTFSFAILYSISTFIAVLTRSPIAALLVTLFCSALLWIVSFAYNQIDTIRNTPVKDVLPGWVYTTADIVNGVLPRTGEIDTVTTKLLAESMSEAEQKKDGIYSLSYPKWYSTFGVSILWIAFFLGLSCWRFSRKDY